MAVIAAQVRKQLRQNIGDRLGAVVVSTTTTAGSTASFVDTELARADNSLNGKHFGQVSGDNDGSVRIIDQFIGESKQGSFRTVMGSAVASGVTYELWDSDMPPVRVNSFINEAIRTITRKGAPPSTDISIHSTTELTAYTVPTALVGIQRVEYRRRVDREDIHNCDGVWSELVDANVTASLSVEDKREGSAANRFVLAAGLAANDIIASQSVGTLDLSGMTHVEFWAKSSVGQASNSLQLILSTTASAGTETELLGFGVLAAGAWTRVRVALSNPESDTAIISVGIKLATDFGAATIWVDGIEATQEGSETWQYVHRNFWRIDKDRRELIFDVEGAGVIRHSLLKLLGRKKPSQLSSDTDSCDIEPEYIIDYAASQLMRARADRNASSREADLIDADRLMTRALLSLSRVQTPSGTRWVSD